MACGSKVALRAVRRRAISHGLRSETKECRGLFSFPLRACDTAKGGRRIRVAEKAETNLGSAGWTVRATGWGAFLPHSLLKEAFARAGRNSLLVFGL
jgi:hypothetical protein